MKDQINKITDLAKMEAKHAVSLYNSAADLKNVVAKEILRGIAFDSQKHEGFYNCIVKILQAEGPAITEEDYSSLEEVINNHIKVEERMMAEAKNLLDKLFDKRIQHLLIEIYNDETKHHALMQRILEAVIRREVFSEEDWWDAVLRAREKLA